MRFKNLRQKAGDAVILSCSESIEAACKLADPILDALDGLRNFLFGRPILKEPSTLVGLCVNSHALRACCGHGCGSTAIIVTSTHKH